MYGAVSSQPAPDAEAPDEPGTVARDNNDDVGLALALAQAARTVEHVVDLGAGRYGVAFTYGPGQRVKGIVLRRSTPSATTAAPSFVVESHIVVATAAILGATTSAMRQNTVSHSSRRRAHPTSGTSVSPVLLRIADKTRGVLVETLRQLRPNERWDIDIIIEDLRDMDALASSEAQ
jgi:hypothetical protein